MNIHEYQGKAVLKEFGAPVSKGFAAFTVEEAEAAAAEPLPAARGRPGAPRPAAGASQAGARAAQAG